YPFFNQIDEALHFDLVVKYASGAVSRGVEPFSDEAVRLIPLFQSPEYIHRFASDSEIPPPLWTMPAAPAAAVYQDRLGRWRAHGNFETVQPPLYYVAAGAWYRLGKLLGLAEGRLLYWLRFLNAFVFGLLVWLTHRWMKRLFPQSPYYRLGVPLLVAFFPQQSAFSINNDAFSPLVFGAAFFALLEVLDARPSGSAPYARAGFLTAAALLVKISNVAIAAAFAVVLALRLRSAAAKAGKRERLNLSVMVLSAVLPVALWCAWNMTLLGDPTGGAYKARVLGWTPRPLGEYFAHPIFSPGGFVHFLRFVALTFWRGEFWWHGEMLHQRWLDAFYLVSSLVFPVWAVVAVARARRDRRRPDDRAMALGFFAGVVSILFLVAMSVVYLFPDGGYPTRSDPFLYSGRLIWGMLVPFALLYLRGLEEACAALRLRPGLILVVLLAAVTAVETVLPEGLFASRYNYFHMPKAPAETEMFR
ncbi:MAG: DUF2142 domain-containing protein, partial [Elusimicrobiota bacterium]